MSTIAVKPTWYNGVFFRSRLEARWAVFFDALGISWRYEPEKYETPHGPYIPDFEIDLYNGKTLIEVKPNSWFAFCDVKPFSLPDDVERYCDVSEMTGMPIYVTGDLAPLGQVECSGRFGSNGKAMYTPGDWDHDFTVCPYCLEVGIEYDARSARMTCCQQRRANSASDKDYQGNHVKLLDAYAAALSARFEERRTA